MNDSSIAHHKFKHQKAKALTPFQLHKNVPIGLFQYNEHACVMRAYSAAKASTSSSEEVSEEVDDANPNFSL
jgi:hypothetical protein